MAAEGQRATESAELGALIAAADGHVRAGRLAEAAAAYRRILALRPRSAAAHNDLGSLLARQGQLDEAAACFAAALALKPDDSAALNNLGIVLARQDRLDEAQLHFERALALRPDDFDALNNVACLLLRRQRFAEAEARLRQLLALRPDAPQTHNNLGTALGQQGKFDQALMHFERAIALLPGHAEAYHNIGNLLLRHGRLAGVAERCQQAIARHADHIDAHLNLATLHLVQGDHERGWPLYEWRLRAPDATQPRLPRWQGQPLAGRRLLLFAEQGLGDTILFVRFARAFQERGAHVVLAAPKPLAALFHGVAGIDEFYALGSTDQLPQCDFYLPLLSAPFALGTTADTIPRDVPYLAA
ncbi:MAG TPA: tetratricopeptide repeat protein, partial [Pirellulales bacterium]|nr:tetratricopeptide repeat protein [Pirellulales bacterium]